MVRMPILYLRKFKCKKMPLRNAMGHCLSFPKGIPQYKAGYIRVTHPCAGFIFVLLQIITLDLHVLSLPLAFILSQDQTLLCIFIFYIF